MKDEKKNRHFWTMADEIRAIEYMTSDEKRKYDVIPTVEEKIFRLQTYLKHSLTRAWPETILVTDCMDYAQKKLDTLMQGVQKT